MEPLRPVFWGQGMFLLPQHFQQQDWYHDARLHRYFHLFVPFCWGIKSLAINEEALQTFRFEVTQCEVVTWDGSLLRFGGDQSSNAKLEPRSFEHDLDPSGRKSLVVYLGVKKLQPGEINLRLDTASGRNGGGQTAGGGYQRFLREESSVSDLYDGREQTAPLQYLVHEAHLFFGEPSSQDYELVKIAEVITPAAADNRASAAADNKRWVLSKEYIPPVVTVKSSHVLEAMITEVRDRLTAKGQELAQSKRQRGGGIAGPGTEELGAFLAMQTVNRYIPLFHHVVEIQDVLHPHIVYAWLRQLVGELSTFSQTASVLGAWAGEKDLPAYDHDDLWPCFEAATRRVKQLLNELTAPAVHMGDVVLLHDRGYFSANLDPQLFAGDNRHYLAIRDDRPWAELLDSLQKKGLIASREEMPERERRFISGLGLQNPDPLPPELHLQAAHYRYFMIDRNSPRWNTIRQRGNIAVYCPALLPETEIHLMIIYSK